MFVTYTHFHLRYYLRVATRSFACGFSLTTPPRVWIHVGPRSRCCSPFTLRFTGFAHRFTTLHITYRYLQYVGVVQEIVRWALRRYDIPALPIQGYTRCPLLPVPGVVIVTTPDYGILLTFIRAVLLCWLLHVALFLRLLLSPHDVYRYVTGRYLPPLPHYGLDVTSRLRFTRCSLIPRSAFYVRLVIPRCCCCWDYTVTYTFATDSGVHCSVHLHTLYRSLRCLCSVHRSLRLHVVGTGAVILHRYDLLLLLNLIPRELRFAFTLPFTGIPIRMLHSIHLPRCPVVRCLFTLLRCCLHVHILICYVDLHYDLIDLIILFSHSLRCCWYCTTVVGSGWIFTRICAHLTHTFLRFVRTPVYRSATHVFGCQHLPYLPRYNVTCVPICLVTCSTHTHRVTHLLHGTFSVTFTRLRTSRLYTVLRCGFFTHGYPFYAGYPVAVPAFAVTQFTRFRRADHGYGSLHYTDTPPFVFVTACTTHRPHRVISLSRTHHTTPTAGFYRMDTRCRAFYTLRSPLPPAFAAFRLHTHG